MTQITKIRKKEKLLLTLDKYNYKGIPWYRLKNTDEMDKILEIYKWLKLTQEENKSLNSDLPKAPPMTPRPR